MTNRPATFKQVDVTRAVKGAVAAGLAVGGFKIDPRTGEIVVWFDGAGNAPLVNEWDEVKR
jgi:hypothetical protein